MIKPFKVLKINIEKDGTTTVFFTVVKTIIENDENGEIRNGTYSLETAINVPNSVTDIDKFLYQHLTETGWIDAGYNL